MTRRIVAITAVLCIMVAITVIPVIIMIKLLANAPAGLVATTATVPVNGTATMPKMLVTNTPVPGAGRPASIVATGVEGGTANVRTCGSMSCDVTGTVTENQLVAIIQCLDGWCEIVQPPGWVYKDYLIAP